MSAAIPTPLPHVFRAYIWSNLRHMEHVHIAKFTSYGTRTHGQIYVIWNMYTWSNLRHVEHVDMVKFSSYGTRTYGQIYVI